VFGVVAGMDFMARPASPSFDGLVDMAKMKVLIAVAEVGERRGEAIEDQGLLMAAKAETVFLLSKRSIKISGIRTLQQTEIVRAMGIVTGRAIFLPDRPVPVIIPVQPFLHVHDLSCRCLQLFIVAGEAKIGGSCLKLFGKIGVMGIMAVQALLIYLVGGVLCPRLSNVILLLWMAPKTERRHRIIQPQSVGRRVRIVTVRAVEGRRRVAESLGQKLFLFFRMAGETEVLPLGDQTILKWRAVGVMAGDAIADGYRTVHFLVDRLIVDVALKAELARRARFQPVAIGRLMRIVAGGT